MASKHLSSAWRRTLVALAALMPGAAYAGCGDAPDPGVNWTNCSKPQLMLNGDDLKGAIFTRAVLSSTNFSKSTLVDARLDGAEVSFSRFTGANLEGADLTKAVGWRADFSGANLEKAKMAGAEMNRSTFTNARLKGATMTKIDLNRSDLSGADLAGVDLSKSELARVNLKGAKVTGVNFAYANLARADLTKLDLTDVDLAGAYLYQSQLGSADLGRVKGLRQDQLDLACGNAETKLPTGLTRPKGWPCKAED